MKYKLILFLVVFSMLLGCGGDSTPTDTPSTKVVPMTATLTATSTDGPTVTSAPTSTRTPIPTDTATPKPTNTVAPTEMATPERTEAQVVDVVDGDTIKVQIAGEVYTLRYIGIDTPETVHPSKPVEWMGPEASAANLALVGGKTVYLEKDVSETDKYNRLLRYVYLTDGTFVNAELVRQGYAVSSTYPPDVKYQDLFVQMEQQARDAGQGLWGPTPEPPTATPEPPAATTASPTDTPAPQPTVVPTQSPPTEPPAATPGMVVIVYIFYDGIVPRVESDEYCEIKNEGGLPVNLAGWRLNAGDPGQDFYFPDFTMRPGQTCRVYTNEHHPESCGFLYGSGKALWNNDGGCGWLYDAAGIMVSEKCY